MFNLSSNLPIGIETVLSGTMAALTNPKHEAFAQAVAKGSSAAEAYLKQYKCKPQSAETAGPSLLRDVQVSFRVEELRKAANEIAEKKVAFGKEQLVEFLVETIQTPIGAVDVNHRQAQEYTAERQVRGRGDNAEEWEVKRLKMCGKMDAAKLLATICGWNAPQKVEGNLTVGVSPVVEEAVNKLLL